MNTQPSQDPQSRSQERVNQYLEKGKQLSTQYYQFSLNILKSPSTATQAVQSNLYKNGIISIILYSILVASFFFLQFNFGFFSNSFTNLFLYPFIYYAILTFYIAGVIFYMLKLMKVEVSFKGVIARFGAFLVIPLVLVLVAVVLSIVKISILASLLFTLSFLTLFSVAGLTLYTYKKDYSTGLDPLYGFLLIYVAIGLFLFITGDAVFSRLGGMTGLLF